MVFTDLPFVERVRRIHEQGFQVEIWDWTAKDLPTRSPRPAPAFTSMTGYVEGDLIDPDGADDLLATAERSIDASRALGIPEPEPPRHRPRRRGAAGRSRGRSSRVRCGWPRARRWRGSQTWASEATLSSRLENLNLAVDHPGTPFARAEDTLALVTPWTARICG